MDSWTLGGGGAPRAIQVPTQQKKINLALAFVHSIMILRCQYFYSVSLITVVI